MPYFVDVILPLPIAGTFTYKLEADQLAWVKPGVRVAVPFGKGKTQTGLVYKTHGDAPEHYDAKAVYYVLDHAPVVYSQQLEFWIWMAAYYSCNLGDVYRAALPSGLRLDSEMRIRLQSKRGARVDASLSAEAQRILKALQSVTALRISEIEKRLGTSKSLASIQALMRLGLVVKEEVLVPRYKPKKVRFVRLSVDISSDSIWAHTLKSLYRAERQRAVFLYLVREKQRGNPVVKLTQLIRETNSKRHAIRSLAAKEIIEVYERAVDRRILPEVRQNRELKDLHPIQKAAFQAVLQRFKENGVVLLKGVTGSGKTEIYAHLIQKQVERGAQVLFLLPKIALTHSFVYRMKAYFGEAVGVFSSHYDDNERVELWHSVKAGRFKVVVTARSGIFLPFQNLGLVIVDEAHDTSYKQREPAPRYHARDAASILARLYGAKVLLGTATPMIETYVKAQAGTYGFATLQQRFNDTPPPLVQVIDLVEARKRKRLKGLFSRALLKGIADALAEEKQVLLFQNRRGYAPVLECHTCGTVPRCPHCDVSLVYHVTIDQLRCHYCGYAQARPQSCLACGSADLNYKGLGTEQIEMGLKRLFPQARIDRMDRDSTRRKRAFETILSKFQNRETDILIGTHMIAKGVDFDRVKLVGIIQADGLLNYPDFRAHERAFQLMTQVAGRAGHTGERGLVIIQTYQPRSRIIRQITAGDYDGMVSEQLAERKRFSYPPYARLIQITLKHRDKYRVEEAAKYLSGLLRIGFTNHLLGPEMPAVGRIRNRYIFGITLKIPADFSLKKSKRFLARKLMAFNQLKAYRSVQVIVDVDPQ